MVKARLYALMADLLNEQAEPPGEDFSPEVSQRLRDGARGADLGAADQKLLWTSPAARAVYVQERRAAAGEVRAQWRRRGFAEAIELRAADGGTDEQVLSQAGVTLRIQHLPAMDDWLISLVLTQEAAAILQQSVVLQLSDAGGEVWLQGALDAVGGIDAYWGERSESPLARLRSFALRLDFS